MQLEIPIRLVKNSQSQKNEIKISFFFWDKMYNDRYGYLH